MQVAMTSADTPILFAYIHPGSMGKVSCTLARSHTNLQHTKLTVDTVDVTRVPTQSLAK